MGCTLPSVELAMPICAPEKTEDKKADACMSDEVPLPKQWCGNNQRRDAKQLGGPKSARVADRQPALPLSGRWFSVPQTRTCQGKTRRDLSPFALIEAGSNSPRVTCPSLP